jgi:membrane dipeptidase
MTLRAGPGLGILALGVALCGCAAEGARAVDAGTDAPAGQIARIHERFVFADMHAHPSRFHRGPAERIEPEELERYRRGTIDVVVAKASSDAAYDGGYVRRDGTRVERTPQNPAPGYPFEFTLDRIRRVLRTVEEGDAVLAESPAAVRRAKAEGRIALLPALEGADGLEGRIENLHALHDMGVRMIQLVHFRVNGLGHIQTDSTPGGLTDFGREVVREMNRRGMIIDLAHANTQTILDVLALSEHPVIFSHTGAKALHDARRHLADEEIRAIAAKGGVIGIWPNGSELPHLEDMVRHIDHVRQIAGIDHVGIGSDLRGMSSYSEGFGEEADFHAIAAALLARGYSEEDVGKVMGGNFFRVWEAIAS